MSNILYYCETTRRGVRYRLEIQPACVVDGSNLIVETSSTAQFNESALLEIGDLEWEYDGLPTVIGAGGMKMVLDLSQLPSGLQTVLKQPIASVQETFYTLNNSVCPLYTERLASGEYSNDLDVCNVWWLWSWNGSSWDLEFAGGQSKTVEREYSIYRDGRQIAEYTLTDIVSCAIQRTPMYQIAGQFFAYYATSDYAPVTTSKVVDVAYSAAVGYLAGKADKPPTNPPQYVHLVKYATLQTAMTDCIETVLRVLVRDYSATLTTTGTPSSHWTFYKQDVTDYGESHARGSSVAESSLRFAGFITKNNESMPYIETNIVGGMLVNDKDGATLLETKYVWDMLKRWCGCFVGKMMVRLKHTGHTSGYFAPELHFVHPFANESGVSVATLDPANSLENPYSIKHGADTLRSVKFQNLFTSDRDIGELTREQPGSLSDKNETIEGLFTNSPTQAEEYPYNLFEPMYEQLHHPNKLCYYEPSPGVEPWGGEVYKIHESCAISDPYGSSYEHDQDNPAILVDGITVYYFNGDTAKGWFVETQLNNNAGVAALKVMLKWFANYNQTERELTFPLAGSAKTLALGRMFTATLPSGFNAQNDGVCRKIQISYTNGTITYTLFHREDL